MFDRFRKKEYWLHLRFTDKSAYNDFLLTMSDRWNYRKSKAEGIIIDVKSEK